MYPRSFALSHQAAPMLDTWSREGCPVDCGVDWAKEWVEAALKRGPHITALESDAIKVLHQECLDKVKNGYSRIMPGGNDVPQKQELPHHPRSIFPTKIQEGKTAIAN